MTIDDFPGIPAPIRLFLDRDAGEPTPELLAVFAEQASVTDEGKTMIGRDAIAAWLSRAASEYTYTSTVTGFKDGVVEVRLEGDFPGGVADLHYRYELDAEGRLSRFVID